ncbi:BtpA/SgcQ family protein [Lactovum odontotermitis]
MFKPNKTILAMIQPNPLPGSYRHEDETINEIVKQVLEEVKMIHDLGFDGVILQNMNDMPVKQVANVEAVSFMTRIGLEIKKMYPDFVLGVLVNWDGVASLAVAEAIGADFIRVEHLFTGASVTSAGILQAQCVEIANLRKRIKSKIPVYADIFEVHGVPLGAKTLDNAAWEAVHEAFADGLFVSGKTAEESIAMYQTVRSKLTQVPIFLGGGATGDNIHQLMQFYDGVSVGTWVKDGDMKNQINKEKAAVFLSESKQNT